MLTGCSPSTSLRESTADMTAPASTWGGSGICTRIPETSGESLRRRTCPSSSACVVGAPSASVSCVIPTRSQARPLLRT